MLEISVANEAENDQERKLSLPESQQGGMGKVPKWFFFSNLIKFATCIPSTCTNNDAMFGLNNFLNETAHTIGGTDTELSNGLPS